MKLRICFLMLSISLTGCDISELELKDYFKCAYVAKYLGQTAAEREITHKLQQYILDNKIQGNSEFAMSISEEVQEDLALYSLNNTGKLLKLLKVYNSSTCQEMHTQGKASPDMY